MGLVIIIHLVLNQISHLEQEILQLNFGIDSDDLGGSNQDGFLQISDTSGGLKTGYD